MFCIFQQYGGILAAFCGGSLAAQVQIALNDCEGAPVTDVYGCTDPTMFNYDPLANIDNGNCIPFWHFI